MKKKANIAFFTAFLCFLCFIFGVTIGRRTSFAEVLLNNNEIVAATLEPNQLNSSTDLETIGKIDINTASVILLQSLPNIGETLAERIVEYREDNGPYHIVEDLLNVKGIGQSRLDEIRQYITVGG